MGRLKFAPGRGDIGNSDVNRPAGQALDDGADGVGDRQDAAPFGYDHMHLGVVVTDAHSCDPASRQVRGHITELPGMEAHHTGYGQNCVGDLQGASAQVIQILTRRRRWLLGVAGVGHWTLGEASSDGSSSLSSVGR